MKKLELEISKEGYERLHNTANWLLLNNKVKNKKVTEEYSVEVVAKGFLDEKLRELEHFNEINPFLNTDVSSSPEIKNRFRELAKEKGVKQSDICRQIGIHKSNLSLIFNNKNQPNLETFFKIWIILKCPPIHTCIYFED